MVDGIEVVVFNVYAPTAVMERELLFQRLAELVILDGMPILLSGDFNATIQDSTDRTKKTTARHKSPTLADLCHAWRIDDCLQDELEALAHGGLRASFIADRHTHL